MLSKGFIPSLVFSLTVIFAHNSNAGPIHHIKVEGIVNPVMGEYITKSLDNAERTGAEALLIELDTPGGLDLSMRDIIKAILSSEIPVIVYISPSGSRAASAGVFITYAAHVAAMAPGTNIGSAHPVAMGGEKMDETMAKKVENDAVAYIKSIAEKRKRNAVWAEKAVRESVNVTADEALKLNVIDLVAEDRTKLLTAIDGRKVEVLAGIKELKTKDGEIIEFEMGLRYKILNTITNPNVAYILMMIGLLGLYFELSNPGVIFPGVIGAICLILAFYAFQTLSVNYAGLLLIGLAVIFFIAELMVMSFGLFTIAGIISLTLGSLMLFESPLPFMRVSVWLILPTIVVVSLFIACMSYYAMRLHRKKPVSGAEALVGAKGVAITDIAPEGEVFVEGEYWKAVSKEPIKENEKIEVVEITGL
ncbi:MAG: nodulation protein NfeD, partial [Deltaproteobacteria bacterium]|nr:nodulation protein NfeD [Deltaproteobacteria bacterium]